jgi:predicted transcriptional regulator
MTPVSFRTEQAVLVELDHFAEIRGTTRSALINQALREMLYRFACERDLKIIEETEPYEQFIAPSAQAWIEPPEGSPW